MYALHYDGVTFFLRNDTKTLVFYDITGEQYRLGGRGQNRIGIGSTREEVVENFEMRQRNSQIWGEFPQNQVRDIPTPDNGFGFFERSSWREVEFEFDENDIVTRMRIRQVG